MYIWCHTHTGNRKLLLIISHLLGLPLEFSIFSCSFTVLVFWYIYKEISRQWIAPFSLAWLKIVGEASERELAHTQNKKRNFNSKKIFSIFHPNLERMRNDLRISVCTVLLILFRSLMWCSFFLLLFVPCTSYPVYTLQLLGVARLWV